jgi:hypothetical protein
MDVMHEDHVPKTNNVGIRDKEHEVSISINRYDFSSNFILGLKREAGTFAEFQGMEPATSKNSKPPIGDSRYD